MNIFSNPRAPRAAYRAYRPAGAVRNPRQSAPNHPVDACSRRSITLGGAEVNPATFIGNWRVITGQNQQCQLAHSFARCRTGPYLEPDGPLRYTGQP